MPGGILLWGPPGTGKTLMAEAVAGETGKPFVFVEPGAFTNMFFGVGVLKVKLAVPKLRKFALSYGGVIVFFDEADSLGNRGAAGRDAAAATPGDGRRQRRAATARPTCRTRRAVGTAVRRRHTDGRGRREPARSGVRAGSSCMGGMGGGGGRMALQALLTELSGLKKPRGLLQPARPPAARHAAEAAAEVPASS